MAKFQALESVAVSFVAGGASETSLVAAPGAGKLIRVHSWLLMGSAAAVGALIQGSGGAAKDRVRLGNGTGAAPATQRPDFLFELAENTALFLSVDAAVTVSGRVTYSVQTTAAKDE
jgi:hypothetical protein